MSDTNGEYRKYRKQTGPGKGDRERIGDRKRFQENYDAIDWKRKSEKPKTDGETLHRS